MTARTERPYGRVIVCQCPLCSWSHTESAVVSDNTLAGVFGVGVMAAVEFNRMSERMETALQDHFSRHTLAEWVQAVTSRDKRITELEHGSAWQNGGRV